MNRIRQAWFIPVHSTAITVLLLVISLFVSGCGGGGGGGGGTQVVSDSDVNTSNSDIGDDTSDDTSDEIFRPERLLQIEIVMDPAEYEVMRREGRSYPQVFAGCWNDFDDYTHFKATVSVDGETFHDVDIRKKGFLGSLSVNRPSIKLDLDDYVPGVRLEGLERLTLNNDRQDLSHTHQCITYQMFRNAGLPAPRCNFARVSMNGQDLGIYTNVENVKKHFLRRNFDNDEGNLYEGQVADFGEFTSENFELKTNKDRNDRSDLNTVVEALAADDENMPGLLEQVIDLDEFISFWAMEAISGHWDGATGNANNYLIYHDPTTDLFHFIPWGTDGAMELTHKLAPGTGPLYRYTRIPSRLYNIPAYREMYHNRILQLLEQVWEETALNTEVSRIRNLTSTPELEMAGVREFIDEHQDQLLASINGDLTQVERTMIDQATVCNDSNITTISGSSVGNEASFQYIDLDGNLVSVPAWATEPEVQENGRIEIYVIGDVDDMTRLTVISMDQFDFDPNEVPVHGVATTLKLYERQAEQDPWSLVAIGGDGSIVFDEPAVLGEAPTMHFSADLWLRIPGERF